MHGTGGMLVDGDDAAAHEVFISYARATMRSEAEKLHQRLSEGSIRAFLDTSELPFGDEIPDGIMGALLASRVVIVLLDDVYLTRWYCVREMLVASEAVRVLFGQGRETEDLELTSAQKAVVVGLGPEAGPLELEHLPPLVSHSAWPAAADTDALCSLAHDALERVEETIQQRLARLGALAPLRRRLVRELELPPPADLRLVATFHETGLPASVRDAFVGRAALMWELHTALKTQRAGPGVAPLTGVVQGGAGFGKTRLALEYLHRYGPRHYPGGLFWVNADVSEDRLEAQFHGILCALQPDTPDLPTLRRSGLTVGDALRRALRERPSEAAVLYVIDNVPEPRPGETPRNLDAWCPARSFVTVLATSRISTALGDVAQTVRIDVLSWPAAVEMLTYGLSNRNRIDERGWQRIADWVGRLPLALMILNASLRQGAMSVSELVAAAGRRQGGPLTTIERQVEALRPMVPTGQIVGIAEAFQISYSRLRSEAQRAARLLARFAPDPIPIAVLTALGDTVFSPSVRAALTSRSFVTEVPDTPVEMFGAMHRLLAEFLRSTGEEEEVETGQVVVALAQVMSWNACKDPRRWPLLDACKPHAEHLFMLVATGVNVRYDEQVLTLGSNLGFLLRRQGHYRESAALRDHILIMATALLGDEHPRILNEMAMLAGTLRRQGELARSRELAERVVEVSARVLDAEHPIALYAKATLAATLRDQRELTRSRDLASEVLRITRMRLGDDHVDTITSMGNLAATLRRMGELIAALALEEEVLVSRRRMHGDDDPETLTAMANLATTLRDLGKVERAKELQEQVLAVRTRLLGEHHSDTLRAIDNLATTLRALGDAHRASNLESLIPEERRTWHD